MLLSEPPRAVSVKGWASFEDKTYRRNVLQNENWPSAPDGGWVTPPTWFEVITDIVRTMFVARYLDGVHFMGDELVRLANELSLTADVDLQAKPEGYYAAHVIVKMPMDLPTVDMRREGRTVGVELQITTQFQEVLRGLLHKQYESARMQLPDSSWQWDWESPQFSVAHLGHMLHYVEGRIVGMRQSDSEGEDEPE